MKYHKEITETRKKIDSVECDICGYVKEYWKHNWKKGATIGRTEVRIEEGYMYPEGGEIEIKEWDICPDCFKKYIIPFLKSLNVKPNIRIVE